MNFNKPISSVLDRLFAEQEKRQKDFDELISITRQCIDSGNFKAAVYYHNEAERLHKEEKEAQRVIDILMECARV